MANETPPNSLKGLYVSLKMKIVKKEGIEVCSLACSTLMGR
jgi:hypothetical protein